MKRKKETAAQYENFFKEIDIDFIKAPQRTDSNYWVCAAKCQDRKERDSLLKYLHSRKIFARAAWTPLNFMPMYKHCITDDLSVTYDFSAKIITLPNSYN